VVFIEPSELREEMAEEEEDPWTRGLRLVSDLDAILESDPYIDEMGFVHPSQLESLHSVENFTLDNERPFFTKTRKKANRQDELDDASEQAEDCSQRSEGQEVEADPPETTANQNYTKGPDGKRIDFDYEKSAFWCAHHKLAIAVPALAPLLQVAKKEFIKNRKEYSNWTDESRGSGLSLSSTGPNFVSSGLDNERVNGNGNGNSSANTDADRKAILEKNLLLYTRLLVIVNCDYASAWNTRKRVLSSMEASEASLLAELRLAGMVLAYGPKSEESWAYRRWVIDRMIAGNIHWKTVDQVLEGDSRLVELIAGRSTMNYRAWRHRYWLVTRMSLKQVSGELQRTKRWAQSHVADNCCFHYRRCLLLGMLQAGVTANGKVANNLPLASARAQASLSAALSENPEILTKLWKEELSWNKDLIQRYVGREALWIHRRFLIWGFGHNSKIFQSTSLPIVSNDGGSTTPLSEGGNEFSQRAVRELEVADNCISASTSDLMEDACRQRELAAAYKLWVLSLHMGEKGAGRNGHVDARNLELNSLEILLKDVSPHRQRLWNGLVPNLM